MRMLSSYTHNIINLTYTLKVTQKSERHIVKRYALTLVPLTELICKVMGSCFQMSDCCSLIIAVTLMANGW